MLHFSSLSFVAQNNCTQSEVVTVVTSLPTFPSASNSVILSSAAYITWKYPTLIHPWYPNYDLSELQQTPDSLQMHSSLSLNLHPLYEAWCDIISKSIFEGNAVRKNDELFVMVMVPLTTIIELQQLGCPKKIFKGPIDPYKCFDLEKTTVQNKRIAIMNLSGSQLRQNQLLPKLNIISLFLGSLFDNQKFDYFEVLKGQVPTKQQLVQYDSIIMPGSNHSALDCLPQVELLASQLRQALQQNKQLRVLGVCFGHHVISKIYGGLVMKKERYQGQENINFIPQVVDKYEFLSGLKKFNGRQMMMPSHHQDFGQAIPHGFQLLAYSQSTKVQAMISKCGRILCFQSHSEYLSDFSIAFEKRLIKFPSQYSFSFNLRVPEERKQEHLANCKELRLCMKKFLA